MMIRRLREEGMTISAIARQLGLNRRTVRRALLDQEPPAYKPREPLPSVLEPYKAYIRGRLHEYDLSAIRLLEEIREKGYPGGYTTVKEFVAEIKDREAVKAVFRFETKPGGQGQADWGEFGSVRVDGEIRKLYAFVFVLGYSRMRYVEFTLDISTPTLVQCHLNAFAYLGGYPREILYDNMKQVVDKPNQDYDRIKWNPLFRDFFTHHGFVPRLCRPYRAQTKGKVEKGVGYVRTSFFEGREFDGLQDANTRSRAWMDVVNAKPHGTTHEPPVDRLKEEPLLKVEDRAPYVITVTHHRKVSRECFVSFLGNKYSVPWKHACRDAVLKVREAKLDVEVAGDVVARHELRAGSGNVVRDREHFRGLLKMIRTRVPQKGRVLEWPDAPHVEARPLSVYDRVLDDYREAGA